MGKLLCRRRCPYSDAQVESIDQLDWDNELHIIEPNFDVTSAALTKGSQVHIINDLVLSRKPRQ
jgi:hypothetical protein